MSGQSAGMSVEEVKKCLEHINHSASHSKTHGGAKKGGGGVSKDNVHTKVKHQG